MARNRERPLVIAHRGNIREAPENTLAAIRSAIELGVDGVEIDVRLTADNVPVLMHDTMVDRTTDGSVPVRHTTLAAMKRLRVRKKPGGSSFSTERVPTLSEVLAEVKGRCVLCVEVKSTRTEEEVLAAIREHDALDWVWLWSFRDSVLREIRKLTRSIPLTLIKSGPLGPVPAHPIRWAKKLGASAVCVLPSEHVTAEVVDAAHSLEMGIYAVVGGKPSEWERLRALGIDAVVADDPAAVLAQWSGNPAPV